jgi:N-acetyl-gamma-glutamylphosphate reductase
MTAAAPSSSLRSTLMKGQSGSAMQNLNLMFGCRKPRLDRGPMYP